MDIEFNGNLKPCKPTAYEELKAWCEKYLDESQWYTCPCANDQMRLTIAIPCSKDFFFNADGSLDWID